MGIIPDKHITELIGTVRRRLNGSDDKPMNGWMAISPLIVFLAVYLISSIIANDFYTVPVSSAFIVASI